MVSDEVAQAFLRLVQRCFQLKYSLPRIRRQFEKGVYDRLLREFALAARVDVPEGSKNAVYLHAILKLSENDFKNAMRDYTLKTKDLDLRPTWERPADGIPDFFGPDDSPMTFGWYIESVREKRQTERFLMELGKLTEETQNKQSKREMEEQNINRIIEICKKEGLDLLRKPQRKGDQKARKP